MAMPLEFIGQSGTLVVVVGSHEHVMSVLSKWARDIQGASSSGPSSATLTPSAFSFQTYSSLHQNMANMTTPMTTFVIINTIHDYMTM
jgi:hypothetical protein